MIYDLKDRTTKFSKDVLLFLKSLIISPINKNIISQLARSATSVGANYCEAIGAVSKNDFKNKIFLCKKEAQETKYWLELLANVETDKKDKLKYLWQETHELNLIFNKIGFSLKEKIKTK